MLKVSPPEETFSTAPLSMTVLYATPPETTFCRPPLSVVLMTFPPNVPSTYWVPPDMIRCSAGQPEHILQAAAVDSRCGGFACGAGDAADVFGAAAVDRA